MASIPGSQFIATAPGQTVNVVETSNGQHLPPPKPGLFNLEIWTGSLGTAPSSPAHGYQGLALLSNSGRQIELVSGTYAVTDNGTGRDSIIASGEDETISGGAANVTLTLNGDNDVANGGGHDTISVYGRFDTVNAVGNDLINDAGTHDLINGGYGNDTIRVYGDHDTVQAGSGNENVNLYGDHDVLRKGTGNETVAAYGSHDKVHAGDGNAVISSFGEHNTISGGAGDDMIRVSGDDNFVKAGTGFGQISILGDHDTVEAGRHVGFNSAGITVTGSNFTFVDGPQVYSDTIVGFSEHAGDSIHLTTESPHDAIADSRQINSGHDTLITLDDGSTILLKGVSHIDKGFFS